MYVINSKTGQGNECTVRNSTSHLPRAVIAFDQFVVLTNSIYNTAIVNRASGEARMFENKHSTVQHAVAFPLSDGINLITGELLVNGAVRLMALDQHGAPIWETKLKILDDLRGNVLPLDLLRIGTSFIVRNSSQLQALDAATGQLLWDKKFPPYTTKALLWNDKVLLITLTEKGMSNNGYVQQMTLQVVEPVTGEVSWSKNFEVTGSVEYVPVNDQLFITSYNSLKVFNAQGEIMRNTAWDNRNTFLDLKMDAITGKSYLLVNGETMYW